MKKQFKLLGLLLVAGLTFAACSSDDITSDQTQSGKWIAKATVGKALRTHTRMLSEITEGENSGQLKVSWVSETDKVYVFKNGTNVGYLTPDDDYEGTSADMVGTLEGNSYAEGQEFSLRYPREVVDYTGQDGTLETISEKYDYAEGTTTVSSVDGSFVLLEDATLETKQAIVHFTFKNAESQPLTISTVKVSATTLAEPIVAEMAIEGTSDCFIALPLTSTQEATYTIECSNSDGNYKSVRSGITMENGMFYQVCLTPKEDADPLLETPLTLEAINGAGNVNIDNPLGLTIKYRVNGGEMTSSNANPITIALSAAGDKIELFGNNDSYSRTGTNFTVITTSNDCYLYGNVNSLFDESDFAEITTIPSNYALSYLFFSADKLYNHPDYPILLPATTLKEGCYCCMFQFCTNLTTSPVLPAATLVMNCYTAMFYGCESLTYVKCLATNVNAGTGDVYTAEWLSEVAANGTFVKAQGVIWPKSEIPNGWEIETEE